jgi:hypothetical protein
LQRSEGLLAHEDSLPRYLRVCAGAAGVDTVTRPTPVSSHSWSPLPPLLNKQVWLPGNCAGQQPEHAGSQDNEGTGNGKLLLPQLNRLHEAFKRSSESLPCQRLPSNS